MDVKDMHEDYIRPQENGSHYDCDYVTAESEKAAMTIAEWAPEAAGLHWTKDTG